MQGFNAILVQEYAEAGQEYAEVVQEHAEGVQEYDGQGIYLVVFLLSAYSCSLLIPAPPLSIPAQPLHVFAPRWRKIHAPGGNIL